MSENVKENKMGIMPIVVYDVTAIDFIYAGAGIV